MRCGKSGHSHLFSRTVLQNRQFFFLIHAHKYQLAWENGEATYQSKQLPIGSYSHTSPVYSSSYSSMKLCPRSLSHSNITGLGKQTSPLKKEKGILSSIVYHKVFQILQDCLSQTYNSFWTFLNPRQNWYSHITGIAQTMQQVTQSQQYLARQFSKWCG